MDNPCKFIDLSTPLINIIKCLLVATSFILAAPVFADTNQKLACYGSYNAGDYDYAFHICTKFDDQAEASEQYDLGVMYSNGSGTPKNEKQAFYWYTKAAEQGDANAQSNLGVMFANGGGTPKNNVLAYVWWNIAAAQGNMKKIEASSRDS